MATPEHQPLASAPGKMREEEGAPFGGAAFPFAAFSPGSGVTLPPPGNEVGAPRTQELTRTYFELERRLSAIRASEQRGTPLDPDCATPIDFTTYLKLAVTPTVATSPELESLKADFEAGGVALTDTLTRILSESDNRWERVVALKLIVDCQGEEQLVNHFLIPALSKWRVGDRSDQSVDDSSRFAEEVIRACEPSRKRDLFIRMNFGTVRARAEMELLSRRLMYSMGGELMCLLPSYVSEKLGYGETPGRLDDELLLLAHSAIQCYLRDPVKEKFWRYYAPDDAALATLNSVPRDSVINFAKYFYPLGVDAESRIPHAEALLTMSKDSGAAVFFDVVSGTAEFARDNGGRFRAARDLMLATTRRDDQASVFQELIRKEMDPVVRGHLCFLLADECGQPGKKALAALIGDEVRSGVAPVIFA